MNASVTGDGTALVTLSQGGLVAVTEHGDSVMVHLDIMGGTEAEHIIIRTAGGKEYDLAAVLNAYEAMRKQADHAAGIWEPGEDGG